jgi:endonuclease-3
MKAINIVKIIKILRREAKKFQLPSVSEISRERHTPFHVLISCILSLRTKDKTTREASLRLFNLADNPEDMLRLSAKRIEKAIFPVGFYRVKSKNILSICRDIIGKFKGEVPDSLDELLSLQGVGRKTANLVLTEGFNKLGICVDTHVHRISNRLGYIRTKTPLDTEMALRKKLPKIFWKEYNTLLVTWGQNICKPINPMCAVCAINKLCLKIAVKKKYRK